jgi:hypothetical protein
MSVADILLSAIHLDPFMIVVGIVWAVTGCVLMAIGPLLGTPTFSGVTIAPSLRT